MSRYLTEETRQFFRALGRRLRTAREEAKVTQTALAQETGVDSNAICRYEHGENRVDAYVLGRLCDVIGVDPAVIAWGDSARVAEAPAQYCSDPALARAHAYLDTAWRKLRPEDRTVIERFLQTWALEVESAAAAAERQQSRSG